MLETLKSSKKAIGLKQTMKAVSRNRCKICFIASDADSIILNDLLELCKSNEVEVIYCDNMQQLGKACGIDVGASTACIVLDE